MPLKRRDRKHLSTKNEQEFVRDEIRQLLGRGKTQRQISEIMKISLNKTNTIVQPLKEESKVNIQKYVNEEQPAQYEITGISQIIDLTWASTDKANNEINISNISCLTAVRLTNALINNQATFHFLIYLGF